MGVLRERSGVQRAVECLCCYEIVERLEGKDNNCITELKCFKTVCLVTKMILNSTLLLFTMLTERGEHFEEYLAMLVVNR